MFGHIPAWLKHLQNTRGIRLFDRKKLGTIVDDRRPAVAPQSHVATAAGSAGRTSCHRRTHLCGRKIIVHVHWPLSKSLSSAQTTVDKRERACPHFISKRALPGALSAVAEESKTVLRRARRVVRFLSVNGPHFLVPSRREESKHLTSDTPSCPVGGVSTI